MLNLYMNLRIDILTGLGIPVHEHNIPLYLFRPSTLLLMIFYSLFIYLLTYLIFLKPEESTNAVPHDHKLCSRISHI